MATDYAKARKKAQEKQENFFLIRVNQEYAHRLLLPHKAGIAFLQSLENAEVFIKNYSDPVQIRSLAAEAICIETIPADDIRRFKMAQLLGVKPEELLAEDLT